LRAHERKLVPFFELLITIEPTRAGVPTNIERYLLLGEVGEIERQAFHALALRG
jgi:hypothetical protein